MRNTQSQVRELLGLPVQTYRYWASSIPHLLSRSGKGAVFTAGDLLGLALTKEVCMGLGLSVGSSSKGIDSMFGLLDLKSWPTAEGCVLVLSSGNADFMTLTQLVSRSRLSGATLLVPVEPVMDELRKRLLPETVLEGRQAMLPLLTPVPQSATGADLELPAQRQGKRA